MQFIGSEMTDALSHDQLTSFDEAWYLRSYPQAKEEIGNGLARNAEEHFRKFGIFRGYLPNSLAVRAENPAAPPSRFGGMWTDSGNAMDLLRGKHTLGLVSDDQAALLEAWIRDGYVILKGALSSEVLERAARDLERAYSDEPTGTIFDCVDALPRISTYLPHHREVPAKALDTHWLFSTTRDAIFAPALVDFIQSVFERRPMATQTLGFWRGSQQDCHQDSAYVSYTLNMHFCASWIAFEDVTPGAGELFYYPGSHKLPDYTYPDGLKNIIDSGRLYPDAPISTAISDHTAHLPGRAEAVGLKRQTFLAKAGDALIWSADLAHGGMPISTEVTRKSLVTHYVPAELTPLYFEQAASRIRLHEDRFPYSTSVYDRQG